MIQHLPREPAPLSLGGHPTYESSEPFVESGLRDMRLRGSHQPFGRGDKSIGGGVGTLSAPAAPQSLNDQDVKSLVSRVY
jgi:hypothetical protein